MRVKVEKSRLIEDPLRLELVFPRGGFTRHHYSALPMPLVTKSLAEAHYSLANTGGGIKTSSSSSVYFGAAKRFSDYLAQTGYEGGIDGVTPTMLRGFMRAYATTYSNA